ncbi:Uncharacterized protein APZ42_026140, partial [Daphnia magna]
MCDSNKCVTGATCFKLFLILKKCTSSTEEQKAAKNLKLSEKRAAELPDIREKRLLDVRERRKAKRQKFLSERQDSQEPRLDDQKNACNIGSSELTVATRVKHSLEPQHVCENEIMNEAEGKREANRQHMINNRRIEYDKEMEEIEETNRVRMAQILLGNDEDQEEMLNLRQSNEAQNHTEMVIVETEEEQQHRLEYLAQNRSNKVTKTHQVAQKLLKNEDSVPVHHSGKMDEICNYCGARHFKGEKASDQKFSICCSKGKVILPPPKGCPELLYHLFTNNHPKSPHFIKMIRNYNNALAFASMGAQIDYLPGRGPYCFRIHGQMYHDTTAVRYQNEDSLNHPAPKYAQLYFIDSTQANQFRSNNHANGRCDPFLMAQLDSLLRQCNPYAVVYKNMRQMKTEEDLLDEMEGRMPMEIDFHNDRRTQDERRYNSPTPEEIAVVFKSIDGAPPENRDIRGHLLIPQRGNRFIRIDTQKPMCDPMTYPLLFPNGEARVVRDAAENTGPDFVEPELKPEDSLHIDPDAPVLRRSNRRSRITQCEYYSSRMSIRGYFNAALYGGPLTQQWTVDSYVKVEANQVKYLQTHQADLHVTQYNGLMDYLNTRAESEK